MYVIGTLCKRLLAISRVFLSRLKKKFHKEFNNLIQLIIMDDVLQTRIPVYTPALC